MTTKEMMIDQRKITYCLTRKRVKNINFRIKADQVVHISANKTVKQSNIEQLLQQKKHWIFKHLDRLKTYENEIIDYETGDQVYYLGKKYPLIVNRSTKNKVWIKNEQLMMNTRDTDEKVYKEKILEEWYRTQAKKIFPKLMEQMFEQLDFSGQCPRVRVIKMKKRYGTCYYRRNQINLNLKLIKADQRSIEFVIAHELVHIRHPNHSQQFYNALTVVMPDWKKREQQLKDLKILNYYNL